MECFLHDFIECCTFLLSPPSLMAEVVGYGWVGIDTISNRAGMHIFPYSDPHAQMDRRPTVVLSQGSGIPGPASSPERRTSWSRRAEVPASLPAQCCGLWRPSRHGVRGHTSLFRWDILRRLHAVRVAESPRERGQSICWFLRVRRAILAEQHLLPPQAETQQQLR